MKSHLEISQVGWALPTEINDVPDKKMPMVGKSHLTKNAKLSKGEGRQHLFFHCGYVSTTADSLSRRIEVAAEGGQKGVGPS